MRNTNYLRHKSMKSWLTKFRISCALEEDKPLPQSLRRKVARSAHLRQFLLQTTAMRNALENQLPKPAPPPLLHSAIMTSIRDLAAADSSVAEPRRVDGRRRDLFRISDFGFRILKRAAFLRRLLPVPALALLSALLLC